MKKKFEHHSLVMLAIGIYLISATGLLVYGLINEKSRPYTIAFIAASLICSFIMTRFSATEAPPENPPEFPKTDD